MNSAEKHFRFWRIGDWGISAKLTFFFLLLALVPVVLVGAFVVNSSRNALLSQSRIQLESASQATARQIDTQIDEQRDFITFVGLLPDIAQYAQNPTDAAARDVAQKTLTMASKKTSDYQSVAIANKQGSVILSSSSADVGADVKGQSYFQEALNGADFISDPSISLVTGQPAIFFSASVKDNAGTVIAVVFSRVNITSIWNFVELDDSAIAPGSYGMLVDDKGIRLAHSSSRNNRTVAQESLLYRAVAPLTSQTEKALVAERRFGKATTTDVQVLPLPEVAAHLASTETTVFETRADTNAVRNLAVMVALRNKPWRYMVAAPISAVTAPADRNTLFMVIAGVVVASVAVLVGLILARSMARPIMRLSKVAERIGLGELDAKIDIDSLDEIGGLAKSISRMQGRLQAAVERLRSHQIDS
jgi:methyl-accepting chemotaxis protein PixJ